MRMSTLSKWLGVSLLLTACAQFMETPTAAPTVTPPAVVLPTATPINTPMSEPTAELPTAPSGWETYNNPRFQYTISYPAGMEGTESGDYSWTLSIRLPEPGGVARNFVYVSVIPTGFQGGSGEVYNYNTPEADILLHMLVSETRSLRESVDVQPIDGADPIEGFTYTRLPDKFISGYPAKAYENLQPWEFPAGTKEIRYYLQTESNLYLIGAYVDTTGSNQRGTITEDVFNQVMATFQVAQ